MTVSHFENNVITLQSRYSKSGQAIYWTILVICLAAMVGIYFIKVSISVKSVGVIRPVIEKAELRAAISTVIDTIYFREGEKVKAGDVILQLRQDNIDIKRSMNNFEIQQRNAFIQDLYHLTRNGEFNGVTVAALRSPVYRQQCSRFVFQMAEFEAQLKKVNKELAMDSILLIDRVIAPKEMFDKLIEHEKLVANIRATREQQVATWQQELSKFELEKSQYKNSNEQLMEDNGYYTLKAPTNGVLQSFNKYYQGSMVQAGEVLAVISPDASLVAECYVSTRDVGLLKESQPTIFQVDAFDYNYFGILTGQILSIDDDYTVVSERAVFKVRCLLDTNQLNLKNGFNGVLKKGMTLQARFVVANRSIWQLLFDKVDDWVNPGAPVSG